MDNQETKEITNLNSEAHQVYEMTQSDGWQVARRMIEDKMMDLQSILNIATDSPESVVIELKARAMAIDTLKDLLRDIQGTAERHQDNIDAKVDDGFVRKY